MIWDAVLPSAGAGLTGFPAVTSLPHGVAVLFISSPWISIGYQEGRDPHLLDAIFWPKYCVQATWHAHFFVAFALKGWPFSPIEGTSMMGWSTFRLWTASYVNGPPFPGRDAPVPPCPAVRRFREAMNQALKREKLTRQRLRSTRGHSADVDNATARQCCGRPMFSHFIVVFMRSSAHLNKHLNRPDF